MSDRADALVKVAEAYLSADPAGEARPAPERQEIVVELGPDSLGDGYRAVLEDGTRVPAETFRRIACDCSVSAVVTAARRRDQRFLRSARTATPRGEERPSCAADSVG